jgi:hypothetical protein
MRSLAIACLALGARLVLAHDIPVSPSTCTFDTFELTEPDTGISASVTPPTSADAMRIVYTVATATAQFQQEPSTPRAFTVGGTPGTIAFPVAFGATLTAAGDLRADGVALGVTVGGVAATVPVTLTTAVVAVGGSVVGGLPMGPDGRFVLVGSIPPGALAPPMNASTTLLRLGCQADPPPDLDQFAAPTSLSALAGVLSPSKGKLRGKLKGGAFATGDLTAGPAILELLAGGATIVSAEFPAGLRAQSARVLVADGMNGSRLTVRLGRGRQPARVVIDLPAVTQAGLSGRIEVQATLVAGTVTARGVRPFRARRGTLRAGS